MVSTLAGTGVNAYADGTATVASFKFMMYLTSDTKGHIYVSDNSDFRVRKVVVCNSLSTFSATSADSLSCNPCTLGTKYRSSSSQNGCQACPANSACNATAFTCNAGYEISADGTGCSQCLDGYSKPVAGNNACSQCAIGTESAANRQSCANCAAGYYRSSLSNPRCILCPTGATCSTSSITRCANGYKKNLAGDGCDQCPLGQDSSDGLNCQSCAGGFFKPSQLYTMCVKCPDGSQSCSGSSVTCQTGYYYDSNVQCKRNDTYFALMQTATNSLSTVTSYMTSYLTNTQTLSLYATATVSNMQTVVSTVISGTTAVQYVTVNAGPATNTVTISNAGYAQTVAVTANSNAQTVTIWNNQPPTGQQSAQSANSVTVDFIGTLPISPLIFGLVMFGIGLFLMLIISLVCCRNKSHQRRKDEEYDGAGMTATGMNTTSQRTFTNTNSTMR